MKFPVQKKKMNDNRGEACNTSNASHQNIVEIEGDIKSIGKESLELYLENTKRSGGGDIEEIDLEANPPRVIFCDPEGKLCIVY